MAIEGTTVVSNRSMDPVYSFGAKSTYKSAVHDNPKKAIQKQVALGVPEI